VEAISALELSERKKIRPAISNLPMVPIVEVSNERRFLQNIPM
jgi:hypothetical protein